MSNQLVRVLVLLAGLCLGSSAAAQSKVAISWKGRKLDAAALPKDLGPAPGAAIALWEPWARKSGYRMDLDASGRVLVLAPASGSRGAKVLQIAGTAATWFDGLLPKPPPRTGEKSGAPSGEAPSSPEVIPEDPEAPPPGAEKKAPAKKPAAWGSGSAEPDSQTATLIALADERDQKSLLEFLAAASPELAAWTAQAESELGFVLEIPLVAAYVESASGQEEWNADFVAGSGAGLQLNHPEAIPPAAQLLLSQPERLALMREQARRFGRPRAALDIAERVLGELHLGR